MSHESQGQLSGAQRSSRIELVSAALRRFGRTDDFGLTKLFFARSLPSIDAVTKLLREGLHPFPAGISPSQMARAILHHVAVNDQSPEVVVRGVPLEVHVISPARHADVVEVVRECLRVFKLRVEQNRGHSLIEGKEEKSQILFDVVARTVASVCDVDLSREPETGRGPVDFKASRGASARVLIELKRASHSDFWNGLKAQLPAYLAAAEVQHGFFVPIVQDEPDAKSVEGVEATAQALSAKTGLSIETVVVDARKPPTASNLKAAPRN